MYTNIDYGFESSTVIIPKSYKQALASPDAERWKLVMDEEMMALQDNNTFSIVELPNVRTLVWCRWVYAGPDGSDVFKARYVAKGYTQVYGLDYFNTFSPTAKMTSVRILMQYAVENEFVIYQLDVQTAYLNAPIDCDIFMIQPEGYIPGNEHFVCKLNKFLYGLKQSGCNWNCMLNEFLVNFGCIQFVGDTCVYLCMCDKKLSSVILIWVVDIIIATGYKKFMKRIKDHLKGKFKMKDMGKINCFVGIQFVQSV